MDVYWSKCADPGYVEFVLRIDHIALGVQNLFEGAERPVHIPADGDDESRGLVVRRRPVLLGSDA